jgi:hypothetical protein
MVDTDHVGWMVAVFARMRCVDVSFLILCIVFLISSIVYGTRLVTLVTVDDAFSFEARAQMVCAGISVLSASRASERHDVKSSPAT